MRVLYFTAQDSPHDRRFLSALAKTEHQVFSLRMHPCQTETIPGITELTWLEGGPDWSCWRGWKGGKAQFSSILNDLQPDLVHAGPVQGTAFLAALVGFHPLVTMSWGSDLLRISKRSPWMDFATRCTLSKSDLLLVDCQTVAEEAVSYGFPLERMVRFPWGVDLAHFSPANAAGPGLTLKTSLGWEDKFVLFCNRTWSKPYGVTVLAEAFAAASQKCADLRLLLAGDGLQSEKVRRILAPVGDVVHFPGWMDNEDLPRCYGAGDLFVSPSHTDGSSISLLEALACGRPALVSDIPSNREWVSPGETGDWFVDGDVVSLENKLLSLASDPNLRIYGEHARAVAEARADWDVNFQKLLFAYELAVR
jgi:L-malate glycosyltransferase